VHFAQRRLSADQISLDRIMGAAVLIDVMEQAKKIWDGFAQKVFTQGEIK
jgi:hypothetical protein